MDESREGISPFMGDSQEGINKNQQFKTFNGSPFKGYWGVTQDDPTSATLFNVVVDAVFSNWMAIVMK